MPSEVVALLQTWPRKSWDGSLLVDLVVKEERSGGRRGTLEWEESL